MRKSFEIENEFLIGTDVPGESGSHWPYRFESRYNDIELNSVKGVFASDIIGNELPVDKFSFTVRYNDKARSVYRTSDTGYIYQCADQMYLLKPPCAAKDYLADADYGTPCWWVHNGVLFARGYLTDVKRQKQSAWNLSCVLGVGMLVEKVHVGNIYTGETFNEVMTEIVGNAFTWVADADVGAVKIFGWLPHGNARRNLHQLLFATGAILKKHDYSDGEIYDFDVIFSGGSARTVSGSHVDINGTVTLSLPASGVEITEHSFSALQSDPVETLYDNTASDASAAEHLPVVFSEPMHNLQSSDPETLIIEESGVNYAIISGVGTLTGQKYTHSETIVSFGDTSGSRVKRVKDNGLITVANSYNVARRVLNYFQTAKTVKARIKLTKPTENSSMEWCGDTLQMVDAWGEPLKAYLSKMELSVTSADVASCELVDGYTPTNGGNNFNRYKIYKRTTSNKTWTAKKDGVIRIILIQGGTGGQGGCAGHVGWGGYPKGGTEDPDYSPGLLIHTAFTYYNDVNQEMGIATEFCYTQNRQESMPGGSAGEPGGQGKLIIVSKEVQSGDIITFAIGKGGKGGNARQNGSTSGGLGAEGTHTTATCTRNGEVIWTVTSEDGAVSDTGFYETFTNTTYALPGEVGHDGGAGGMTSADSLSYALNASKGLKGGSVGEYSGGVGGKGASHNTGMVGRLYRNGPLGNLLDVACGGGGGGAAWGATGSVGGDAKVYAHPEDDRGNPLNPYIISGKGGDGANAVAPAKAQPGCGGIGGNGGGSGGNSGGGTVYKTFQGAGYDINVGRHLDVAYPGTQYEYEYLTHDDFGGGLAGKGSAGGAGGDGLGILYYEG